MLLHHGDGLLQLHQTRQGKESGRNGNDEALTGNKGVNRQQPQRGGIVDDDVVVAVLNQMDGLT